MGTFKLAIKKFALVALVASMLLSSFTGASRADADVNADQISVIGVTDGASVANRGTLTLSTIATGLSAVELGLQVCQDTKCWITSREYLSVCSRFQLENNVSSYFGRTSLIGERTFSGATFTWTDSSHLSYSIDAPGTYKFTIVRVQTDGAYCGGSRISLNLNLTAPKALDSTSSTWVTDAQGYEFKFLSACDFEFNEAAPGQKKTCTYRLSSTPTVTGSIPVEYTLSTNDGAEKVIGQGSAAIGAVTTTNFTVPTSKAVINVRFQVRPRGAQKSSYLAYATVVQKPDPKTLLSVRISGPNRVIRGTAFTLKFTSSPKVTGSCLLTSYPEGAYWGDLGTVKLVNGSATKRVTLLWPKRLGDGFTVGASLKCNIGKRNSFDTYGAMGYLP